MGSAASLSQYLISSQESPDPFAGAFDNLVAKRTRSDQHGAVEGLANHEIGELRGDTGRVCHSLTRSWFRYGILAGPFYLTVGLIQAFLREGFDLGRHPLSVLANGAGGRVQTANFVLTGLMVLAASVAFGRVLGAKSRGMTGFLGGYGLAMLLGAVFPADPVDGFPPGTPEGMPTSISTTGLIHFAAGALAFICLAISCFFAARVMSRRNESSLARLSLFSGLAVLVGFFGGMALPFGILGIWFAVIVGWAWLSIISLHLYRVTTSA